MMRGIICSFYMRAKRSHHQCVTILPIQQKRSAEANDRFKCRSTSAANVLSQLDICWSRHRSGTTMKSCYSLFHVNLQYWAKQGFPPSAYELVGLGELNEN